MKISNRVSSFFYRCQADSKQEMLGQIPWLQYIFLPSIKMPLDSTLFHIFFLAQTLQKNFFQESDFSSPIIEGIFDFESLMNLTKFKKKTLKDSRECRFR